MSDDAMEKVRTFIALPVPHEVRRSMADIQTELIATGADVKWEAADKFHITLKFLGDTSSVIIASLAAGVQDSVGNLPPFEIVYTGLGAFPHVDRPKVVWIGTNPCVDLQQLQGTLEDRCASFGFAKEARAFHAHITLGRVKGNRGLDRLTATLKSVTFQAFTTRCTEIHIMRSDLKPSGSVYTLLNTISLAP